MRSYGIFVSIRKLLAILVALSVLFAPALTGAAMAAAPHHDMQMMEGGHCQAPPSKSVDHDKMGGKNCCISMCTAVAIPPSAPAETAEVRQQIAQFVPPKTYHGLLTEIATPPPRHS
jgi:hypothetical protein